MTKYNEEEERKFNNQLRRWQKRQMTAVKNHNIDKAYAKMNDIDRAIWEKVANAETYKDVNWIVWYNAENVISKYCKLAQ